MVVDRSSHPFYSGSHHSFLHYQYYNLVYLGSYYFLDDLLPTMCLIQWKVLGIHQSIRQRFALREISLLMTASTYMELSDW